MASAENTSATLHVPAGSVDKYKAASPRNEFGNIMAIEEITQEYYPEGTKWTEIRLDTLKYDSWYSKVGDEWVPNFETIQYYVQGEYKDWNVVFKKVYSNGPEWTDSLTLLITNEDFSENRNRILVTIPKHHDMGFTLYPSEIYQFDWSTGMRLWFQDLLEANATCYPPCGLYNYGMIDEIKEGDFGGVRPLRYVDLNGKAPTDKEQPWLDYTDTKGGRIIQGIGITEWNDGECLFGPVNPYFPLSEWVSGYEERHYRSMLVHFERNGEVLYDVWPEKGTTGISATLNGRGKMMNGVWFDLQGRRISGKPAHGIYIEDGKKKVRY